MCLFSNANAEKAYFEGQNAGKAIAACLKGNCVTDLNHKILHGTTRANEYNASNGTSKEAQHAHTFPSLEPTHLASSA